MFTVCPKCMLTLAVTANDLRMGQGYVRCGRCANVFNALLTLSEEPTEESTGSPPPTPADRASQSQISRAMRDVPAPGEEAAPGAIQEPTRSQVEPVPGPETQLPTEQSSDGSIENESNRADGTGTFETIVLEGEAITQIEEYVPEESVDSELAALTQRLEMSSQEPVAAPAERASEQSGQSVETEPLEDAAEQPEAPFELASDAERDQPARPRWPWLGGISALSLLLALQMVHHWRDALAATPALAAPLTRVYAGLGMPLDPHWDLAAYDVRQQGAAADPNDGQLIRVRLSLANHAQRAQPLPVIRLTLLDRYGKRIATSDLPPEQYWPAGSPPHASLAHDERVDTEVTVRDANASSASFELDVCLRNPQGALRCASELPTR